jgi:hypothetical protein
LFAHLSDVELLQQPLLRLSRTDSELIRVIRRVGRVEPWLWVGDRRNNNRKKKTFQKKERLCL